jgi:hypothetical protein
VDHLQNIVSKNSHYPAKKLWPVWPENVLSQPSGQVKIAGLAGKWPDLGKNLLLIAVFVAVFSNAKAQIKKNGNNGHCRNAVFKNKDSL